MNQTNLPQISDVIAGTMRLGAWGDSFNTNQYIDFIEHCLQLDVTTFDHADIYGDYTTESDFGKALAAQPTLRDQIQIITKCGIQRVCEQRPQFNSKAYNSSAAHIIQSVDQSLKNLQTEYIDILLLHRPDYLMHPEEVTDAFTKLHGQGKVNWFGVSNFNTTQFDLLNTYIPLVTNQIEISLFHRSAFDDGTIDQCLLHCIPPTAWSPVQGWQWKKDSTLLKRLTPVLKKLGERYSCTETQLLYAFLYKHPSGIKPIVGTTKLERIQEALDARIILLSHEEWYELWQAASGERIP